MVRSVVVLVSSLVVVALTGCAGAGQGEVASPPSASPSTSSPEPSGAGADRSRTSDAPVPGAVPESLDFVGTTVSGSEFEGSSLQGRPTLLWFWAPWCPTCRGQIPQVEGLADEYAGELNIVGVGSLDSSEAIAGFAADIAGITHLEDTDGELWKRFGVTEQSSFVLLDEDGSITFQSGYGGTAELDARVADVVG
jgi:thiol-disulfide isomerase/thioredoxin